jgi:hypothetical protein
MMDRSRGAASHPKLLRRLALAPKASDGAPSGHLLD